MDLSEPGYDFDKLVALRFGAKRPVLLPEIARALPLLSAEQRDLAALFGLLAPRPGTAFAEMISRFLPHEVRKPPFGSKEWGELTLAGQVWWAAESPYAPSWRAAHGALVQQPLQRRSRRAVTTSLVFVGEYVRATVERVEALGRWPGSPALRVRSDYATAVAAGPGAVLDGKITLDAVELENVGSPELRVFAASWVVKRSRDCVVRYGWLVQRIGNPALVRHLLRRPDRSSDLLPRVLLTDGSPDLTPRGLPEEPPSRTALTRVRQELLRQERTGLALSPCGQPTALAVSR